MAAQLRPPVVRHGGRGCCCCCCAWRGWVHAWGPAPPPGAPRIHTGSRLADLAGNARARQACGGGVASNITLSTSTTPTSLAFQVLPRCCWWWWWWCCCSCCCGVPCMHACPAACPAAAAAAAPPRVHACSPCCCCCCWRVPACVIGVVRCHLSPSPRRPSPSRLPAAVDHQHRSGLARNRRHCRPFCVAPQRWPRHRRMHNLLCRRRRLRGEPHGAADRRRGRFCAVEAGGGTRRYLSHPVPGEAGSDNGGGCPASLIASAACKAANQRTVDLPLSCAWPLQPRCYAGDAAGPHRLQPAVPRHLKHLLRRRPGAVCEGRQRGGAVEAGKGALKRL